MYRKIFIHQRDSPADSLLFLFQVYHFSKVRYAAGCVSGLLGSGYIYGFYGKYLIRNEI